MLKIFYRYCPHANNAFRPRWFSRKLCLASFMRSYDNFLKSGADCSLCLAIDCFRELKEDEEQWLKRVIEKYQINALKLKSNSNCLSYLEVFNLALKLKDDAVVLFAEDDYLWKKDAIVELYSAIQNLPADYVTPYDHPVRYDESFREPDLPHWEHRIFHTNHYHYRSHESTCMTFMSRAGTLKEDAKIHKSFTVTDKKSPNDREIFRSLQHLGRYSNLKSKRRLLIGPMPSLATHAHLPYLAPTVNWYGEVRKVKKNNILE